MKKIIAVLLILMVSLVMISGCDTKTDDSDIPQPPALPDDSTQNQQQTGEIPQPPALPEE